MELDTRVGGDSAEDRIWLVTDAACGPSQTLSLDSGDATSGIALAIEARILDGEAISERFDFVFDLATQAPALVGMLMEQLPAEVQEHLVGVWRTHGVAGL